MIRFEHVSFWYSGSERPALRDVSFFLPEGTFTLMTGPSGAGKSTLLRCLNGLVPHFSGGLVEGNISVNGLNPVIESPKVMSRHVGFVFQDPEAQFVMDRVEDEVAFALENAALPRQEMRVRVEEVLDLLDLEPLRDRRLETLSGGERQRVAIAAALALRPQILVLDEPTSQLDPKSAEDVLNALARLNSDLGLTVVVAEHRLERVVPFVDEMLYLDEGGEGLLAGSPRDVLSQIKLVPPLVALAQRLGWEPLPLTIKEGRRFSRTIQPNGEREAPAPPVAHADEPFIEARGVRVRYGENETLRGVDFEVFPGEVVALMGRNGAGKSTLLKTLVGLVRPQRGKIRVGTLDAAQHDVATLCRQVGYLPQDPNALLFAETVAEEWEITLRNHGLLSNGGPLPIQPETLLARFGLSDKAAAYPRDLSTGERQRVALGAVMITQARALLLDEPTRGLDALAKEALTDLLRSWRDEGIAIVLVTHDVELAAAVADRVVLMSQGDVIANGPPSAILGSSPLFAPQIAHLFPGSGWLTVADALRVLRPEIAK
ncbi:MAG TPA: energy-coupling factor transporter ATPase [Ardenticatenaceae bacterium]|jgi:energy-coupling factor transport system ATP-binding protein